MKRSSRRSDLRVLLLIVILAFFSFDAWGDWAIKGEGNFSCPDYVSAKRTNSAKLYSSVTWVQGFITGVNYQRALEKGTHSLLGQEFPATSIVQWLENHCRENPQDYLSDAAEKLVVDLKEKDKSQN
jgi:hypothetical protein